MSSLSVTEKAIRTRARLRGFRVHKSRDRSTHTNNHGLFLLVDDRNHVVIGDRYDATLAEIASHLDTVHP
jgi:hypothetical protein